MTKPRPASSELVLFDSIPMEVHDHFRKAYVLHGYVEEHLGEAAKHALETGQELLAAKKAIPHGRWVEECDRLFPPSARTARFYMSFAKDMTALPKRQQSAVLMLEGTLTGAAKLAKAIAKKNASEDEPPASEDPPSDEPEDAGNSDTPSDWVEEDAAEEPEEEPTIEEIVEAHNKAIESFCRAVRKQANAKPEGVEWLDHKGRWEGYFRKVCQGLDTLRSAKAVICPACDGENCGQCDNLGYLPKMEAEGVH